MSRNLYLVICFFISNAVTAQLYQPPHYPQYYFAWPTDLKADIVANMGELRNNHWHMGLDVRTNGQENKRVLASADGYIAYVGIEPLSWGRWIIINHPNGYATLYGHLNTFRADIETYVKNHQYQVKSWQTDLDIPPGLFPVKKGDFISYSGSTGGSQGPHIHWEIIDQKTKKRLNPTLFGTPITDNLPPVITRIALYDRNISTYDQSPQMVRLAKNGAYYTVPGNTITTPAASVSIALQAYDVRNGTANQDGIYSARVFMDDKETTSFYIDNISYPATRYMNAHVDYKMKASGGPWVQHTARLPGDESGIYHYTGENGELQLHDTYPHAIKILVADANGNTSTIAFSLRYTGIATPQRAYEWQPAQVNNVYKYDFEAHLPAGVLYDRMNSGYQRLSGSGGNSVSAKHKLGETSIPAHSELEVCIKADKTISYENKNRIVIKRTGTTTSAKKAVWDGDWMTATFKDFGYYEAFVDNEPPVINNLGSGDPVNLSHASRIVFTPTDNYGIADFTVLVDGNWIRFTNDKGRLYIYNFDEKIPPGLHTLTATATDIAGNKTVRTWRFVRGATYTPPPVITTPMVPATAPKPQPAVIKKNAPAKKAITKTPTPQQKSNAKHTAAKKAAVPAKDIKKTAAEKNTKATTAKKPATAASQPKTKTPAKKK